MQRLMVADVYLSPHRIPTPVCEQGLGGMTGRWRVTLWGCCLWRLGLSNCMLMLLCSSYYHGPMLYVGTELDIS